LHTCGEACAGTAWFVAVGAPGRPDTRSTRQAELPVGRRSFSRGAQRSAPGWRAPLRVAAKREGLFRVVQVLAIDPIKHAKLMYNAAISPLAAAAGIDNGKLLSVPAARHLFFALLQENHRILTATGIALG